MKQNTFWAILWLIIGVTLVALSAVAQLDGFWSGMGTALLVIGTCRLLRDHRLNNSAQYREKMEIYETDERLHFIRAKAWSWAGYLFILIAALAVIVLKLLSLDLYATVASGAMCLMLVLYWGAYLVLHKKY